MNRKIIALILIILTGFFPVSAQKIKVACVGNSVTFGMKIKNRELNSYPAQLQRILGNDYEVANFGHSGATALKNGHKPYWEKPEFILSKEFAPNIVIIHLGLNDQGLNNWPKYKDEFVKDYLELINAYESLLSKPKVIVCKMTPTFSGHHWFEEGMRENFKEVQLKIKQISKQANVDFIDLHKSLYRFPEFFPDNIHPTKEGAAIIANKVFSAITGNFGGLQLSILYGEEMVFQRNEPILFTGTANANDTITIIFNNNELATKVNNNGEWNITFPTMVAGGPYKLTFKSKFSNDIIIDEVFIGDVWLASGQSNMVYETENILNSETVLKDSINSSVHLFKFEGKAYPSDGAFGKDELENCNAASYFISSGWQKTTAETLSKFSAIAYSFAFNLQKELNIPIGIICNAIGGATTQSWISRETMERKHETIDLLNDTHLHPMTQPWVSERKIENFANLENHDIKARHPFDPTFMYDAGIFPIKDFNLKGVIWYQGESNAERISFHSMLFETLIKDWRFHWNKPELPFYYVQLSSINRSTWGYFRDSQRILLSRITNTGMAVSSDHGHRTNVHPIRKWVVGERLSKIALAKTYNKKIPFSGPLLDYVNVNKNKLEVHFLFGEGLKTSDGEEVIDIQIAGEDKVFVDAETHINGDILEVWSKSVKNPRYIKYAYTPYTEGNLINKYGLPASTFSNLNYYNYE